MIEISVSICLDAGDVVTLGEQLAVIARWFAPLAQERTKGAVSSVAIPEPPFAARGTPAKGGITKRAKLSKRPANIGTPDQRPSPAANDTSGETAAGAPTTNTDMNAADDKRARLPFAELDPLVRSELKRLSMDGRIPNYKLWDSERDPRLPTLGAILARYDVTNLGDFAAFFGMEPPLSALANPRAGFRASLPESNAVAA